MIYTKENPANSLDELIDFIESDSPERFLFRGQTTDYDALIPSIFRSNTNPERTNIGFFKVDQINKTNNSTHQDKLRSDTQFLIHRLFGKSLGHLICQQYGVTSTALDVTESPRTAAFFASKSWPEYSKYNYQPDEVGVIYRIQKPINAETDILDDLLSSLHIKLEDARKIRFTHRIDSVALRIRCLDQNAYSEEQKYNIDISQESIDMIGMSCTVMGNDVEYMFKSKCKEIGLEIDYSKTRISKQSAGAMYPQLLWNAWIPNNIGISGVTKDGFHLADPPAVAAGYLIGLGDFFRHTRIDSFYFKHTDKEINLPQKENLWPSQTDDMLFKLLLDISEKYQRQYVGEGVDMCDMENGIFDRGYY